MQIEIVTGVTHQIRVHSKHLGLPLIGDPIYQPTDRLATIQATRLGLHAERVEFKLQGLQYQIEATPPLIESFF